MSRRVTLQTPLGELLQLRQLQGTEAISQVFALDLDLLSTSRNIDPKAVLGKTATVMVETEDGGTRYLDGIITLFGMQGQDHRDYAYRARLSPWLWLATRKSDFRIFQNLTVPEIIDQVLAPYGYPLQKKLTRGYRRWDYCVQYNETDCQFVSRLMEHEGIYYYHQHSAGQHVLTLADDILASHAALAGAACIPFYPPDKAAVADRECIHAWSLVEEVKPGRHYNDDYDFAKPRAELSNLRQLPSGHAHDGYEVYEWPGGYTDPADGATYARVRLEESLTLQRRVTGEANHRALAPGYTFTLENYPREDQNQPYLITAVTYFFQENPRVSDTGGGQGSIQRFELCAQPTTLAFKPPRLTPKPRTTGPQTAVVVGPAGEEIWTDQYGRVKVQFHWDRIGQHDENSSCWVRVSSPWAGSGYGGIHIPRIGQEVIVDFLNGDPDYPIITGRVYNAAQMPPWELPANKTQSGILTRSTKGGVPGSGMKDTPGTANALRFEDKAGEEQLWLHAQKDQLTEVEHDEDKWVGNDRRKTIDRDETSHIKRDRTETVDRDETVTVHRNQTLKVDLNRSKTVGADETDSIGSNWRISTGRMKIENIGIGYMQNTGMFKMMNVGMMFNQNVGVMMATIVGVNQSTQVGRNKSTSVGTQYALNVGGSGGGASLQMNAQAIELKVGAASLTLQSDGTITLAGKKIFISASGDDVVISGRNIDLN